MILLWENLWTLAQSAPIPDTPAGWAGWVGFGASGGVLAWYLLVRTPALDRMIKDKDEANTKALKEKDEAFAKSLKEKDELFANTISLLTASMSKLREDKDKQLDAASLRDWEGLAKITASHTDGTKNLGAEFRQTLASMMDQCDKENTRWANLLEKERERSEKKESST